MKYGKILVIFFSTALLATPAAWDHYNGKGDDSAINQSQTDAHKHFVQGR